MKYLLMLCLLGLTACGPAANSPSQPSGASSSENTAKVMASKQAYLSFLACAKTAESSSTHQATIQTGIDNVNTIPEAGWESLKASLSISAKDFVERYPSCAK